MLITCPECKSKISESASRCSNCGFEISKEVVEDLKTSEGKGALMKIISFALLGSFLYFMFIPILSDLYDSNENDEGNRGYLMDAYRVAKISVTERLKSPSTAKFPKVYIELEKHIEYLGDGKYKIDSYVDHQNVFGGIVRTKFKSMVEESGGDWRLISLEIDGIDYE